MPAFLHLFETSLDMTDEKNEITALTDRFGVPFWLFLINGVIKDHQISTHNIRAAINAVPSVCRGGMPGPAVFELCRAHTRAVILVPVLMQCSCFCSSPHQHFQTEFRSHCNTLSA